MPRLVFAGLLASALAAPAGAETPVSPEAFEGMAEGRTLHFSLDGEPFGSEQYLPGRRTLWRFADGPCQQGVWRAEGDLVCFAYDAEPGEQCWSLSLQDGRLSAALAGPEGFVLRLSHSDEALLACPGPDIGA